MYKTINVDTELHKKLKLKAIGEGTTITKLLDQTLRGMVDAGDIKGYKIHSVKPIEENLNPKPGETLVLGGNSYGVDSPKIKKMFPKGILAEGRGTQGYEKLCKHGAMKGLCKFGCKKELINT